IGSADQGWVAWFLRAAIADLPISICGNGKQVRDLLFVDDLLDAYDAAVMHIDSVAGEVFNVGGGPERTMSIWAELAPHLSRLVGRPLHPKVTDWRPGDQRIYVSDIRKAEQALGWRPVIGVEEGLRRLYDWTVANLGHLAS